MSRRLFHLAIKASGEHKYYGSLAAIFLDNKDLGVSKFTLDRFDFSEPFENEKVIIRKSWVLSAGDIRGLAPK
ncbi:MAG: hypothetical protein IPM10_12385 [Chitinophagaceae bacterium]|nr:hypothetical protein [Chitinophagaceae bacterium]